MSFFEWFGRVVMLVLAGMITLSIIGAIAAIPSGIDLSPQIRIERPFPPAQQREVQPARPPIAPEPGSRAEPIPRDQEGSVTSLPARPEPVDAAEWLEVIAYALLALSGLMTIGMLLLWRLLHQQRRIADALSAAPPASYAPPSAASPPAS